MQPLKAKYKRNEGSGVGTFKLADEAQMGNLSSLMISSETNGKCVNNNNKFMANSMDVDEEKDDEKGKFRSVFCYHKKNNNKNNDWITNFSTFLLLDSDGHNSEAKDELHRVLGETNSFLQSTMKGYEHLDEYPFETNATNNNIPQKLLHNQMSSSSSPEMKHFELDSPDDDQNPYDSVFGPKKSSRACKGKRYMEYMNAQKLNMITKRTKPRTTSTSSSTSLSPTQSLHVRSLKKSLSCSQAVQKLDYDTFDHLYANHSPIFLPSIAAIKKNETDAVDHSVANKDEMLASPSDSRKFDVTEFELEQKINALQAHNLDEYLVRKQDTKKKKKPSDKRSGGGYRKVHKVGKAKVKSTPAVHAVIPPKTFEEARLAMVGSQKRKARKESITRRDVQQVTAIVQSFSPTLDPHFMPMVSTSFGCNATPNNTNRCGNSGLLMLATMAEVAAANYAV